MRPPWEGGPWQGCSGLCPAQSRGPGLLERGLEVEFHGIGVSVFVKCSWGRGRGSEQAGGVFGGRTL